MRSRLAPQVVEHHVDLGSRFGDSSSYSVRITGKRYDLIRRELGNSCPRFRLVR